MKERKLSYSNIIMISSLIIIALVQVFRLSELSFLRASLVSFELGFLGISLLFVFVLAFIFFYLPVVVVLYAMEKLPLVLPEIVYPKAKQFNIRLNTNIVDRTYVRLSVFRC